MTGETIWLPGQGERRQVTTLVCSRGVLGDFEELPETVSLCERFCEPIFNRFEGKRAPRQGDACLVYFGYPKPMKMRPAGQCIQAWRWLRRYKGQAQRGSVFIPGKSW